MSVFYIFMQEKRPIRKRIGRNNASSGVQCPQESTSRDEIGTVRARQEYHM